ncbi:HK97 family phage prohead protease [Nocardia paucivorans]|uniref:HK97 family phage prohead protease n=1 Tax=Nocardia paucivorans TaxID=114259 RepID=UPI000312B9CA|nr:HK97 family phage prohead protease [Nocardia paucivorans]
MSEILHRYATVGGTTGRTVHGLAVPFGEVAEVRDGYGPAYRERFVKGAFARTIAERSHKVRLMAMHNSRALPIGRATELVETTEGLRVAFAVSETTAGNDALALVRDGTVSAFSIGFVPVRHRTVDGVLERLEVSLREVSLVTEPAYAGAAIAGVRSGQPARIVTVDHARRIHFNLFEL